MMGSTSSKTGPWIFDHEQDATSLIDTLNTLLPPTQRVFMARFDTTTLPNGEMSHELNSMHPIERVHVAPMHGLSDQPRIHIPIGSWIIVPTRPLVFQGREYPSLIDIRDKVITVRVPYLFKVEPDRVDEKHYKILPLSSNW